jgi:hypothetical protein
LSRDSGATWTALQVPSGNSGQASTNLALAIDPNNPNIVYLAEPPTPRPTSRPWQAIAWCYRPMARPAIYSLTYDGTANGSAPHADARTFVFDRNGRLVMGGDGGVFVLTGPSTGTGEWAGLNTSALSVRESYAVAYDAVSKRIVVAAQDTGVAYRPRRARRCIPRSDRPTASMPR